MIKNITRLEHKIGDKVYHFFCDQDSAIHEVKEALIQFISLATQIGNATAQAKAPEAPTPEAAAPVVKSEEVKE